MSWKAAAKIACLLVIALPGIIASVQGVSLPPTAQLGIALAGSAAGLILGELDPSYKK